MKVVLVMFKGTERREFPITALETVLGRRQDCGLRIPTKDVSRQHCALVVDGQKISIKDLGSSNGTYVNGKRVAEHDLAAGDRLRLGPVTFMLQVDGKPANIKPSDLKAAAAPPDTEPSLGGDDEETFEISDADFDIDAVFDDLDDEKDMP
ncbi:MAG: FHA domain-containing protein [Phycisphaerales bacterium]|nr:FHA domain-containing protein [Phycisphaerales bacterium]